MSQFIKPTKVQVKNSTANSFIEDVVGNKTDDQTVAVALDKSLVAYCKGILTTVLAINNTQTEVSIYAPQAVDVGNVGHIEACIVDKDVGLIPAASLVAGTFQLVRVRGAASTNIGAVTAWSKSNGRIFTNVTFAAADWAIDDAFQIVPQGDTTYTVGIIVYYPAIPTISGYIGDLSTIEGKIDSLLADVGDGSASALGSVVAILGNPNTTNLSNQIGADGFPSISTQIGFAAGGSVANELAGLAADIGDASGSSLLSLYAIIGNPSSDPISDQIGTDGLDSLATQIGCDGVQSVNTQLGFGAAGSVSATLGAPVASISADIVSVNTEVESLSLATAGGSNATLTRSGSLLRWLVDNVGVAPAGVLTEVETTSLDAGDGLNSDNVRAGVLARWTADALVDYFAVYAAPDSIANASIRDVVGRRDDSVAGGSLVSLVKINTASLLTANTNIGDASGDDLTSLVAKLGDDSVTVKARFDTIDGNIGSPLKSAAASTLALILGDPGASNISTIISGIPTVTPDAAGVVAALIGTPVSPAGTVIGDISLSESNIRGTDSDTLKILSDQLDGVASAVLGVQNNTRLTCGMPINLEIPDAGSAPGRIFVNLYDTDGHIEDPDGDIIAVTVTQDDGTDVTARLFKEVTLTTPLDTIGAGTFTGLKQLVKSSTGRYICFYKCASTDTPENVGFRLQYEENTLLEGADRIMSIGANLETVTTNVTTLVADIGSPLKSAATSTLSLILGDPGASDIATIVSGIPTVTPDAAGTLATAIAVPIEDAADDLTIRDVVGKKTDTILGTSLVALVKNATLGVATGNNESESTSLATAGGSNATLTRAGLLLRWLVDNAAIESSVTALKTLSSDSSGTFQYLVAGGEQIVNTLATSTRLTVQGIWLDLSNMTQNGTIKIYYKVDGSNYRLFSTNSWLTTDEPGQYINLNMGITNDLKVTYTAAAPEGVQRGLPYSIIYDIRE